MATTDTLTITACADSIRACQERSNLCWQMAIDTSRPDARDTWESDAEECDGCYEHALEMLETAMEDYRSVARAALTDAQYLERRGGDDQHATAALDALARLESDEAVR